MYGTTPKGQIDTMRGTVLAGRYRVEQALGQGAFARVHAGWDMLLHRWVAVKITNSSQGGRISEDEARLQSTCQHPNLMPLYDAGTDARLGLSYIVMPLYPGSDLAQALRRFGPMSYRAAVLCVDQICSALEFLQSRRHACHGDVKPSNIWLTQSGAALLMDFNLHGLLIRQAPSRIGTPGFAPPEALQGRLDARSDVFSLGCVLYTCLTGTPPFANDAAVLKGKYTPLRTLRPEIGQEMEATIRTALQPNPDRRFQSARELQSALRRPDTMTAPGWLRAARLTWSITSIGAKSAWRTALWYGRLVRRRPGIAIAVTLLALFGTGPAWRALCEFTAANATALFSLFMALVAGVAGTLWGLRAFRRRRSTAWRALKERHARTRVRSMAARTTYRKPGKSRKTRN
jgi:serine/threonine protein kinase